MNVLTETDVKNILAPICKDLNSRIDIIETVLRDECESEIAAGAEACVMVPPAQDS